MTPDKPKRADVDAIEARVAQARTGDVDAQQLILADIPALIDYVRKLGAVVAAAQAWAKDDKPIDTDAEEQLFVALAKLGEGDE